MNHVLQFSSMKQLGELLSSQRYPLSAIISARLLNSALTGFSLFLQRFPQNPISLNKNNNVNAPDFDHLLKNVYFNTLLNVCTKNRERLGKRERERGGEGVDGGREEEREEGNKGEKEGGRERGRKKGKEGGRIESVCVCVCVRERECVCVCER